MPANGRWDLILPLKVNVMLVLQSCTDPLHILPGSSGEIFATSSDCSCDIGNMKVEEDVDVIETRFTGFNEEAAIAIKQEEAPEDITSPDIKAVPDEVSYMCIYVCY
jgi:hypothetical protein